MTEISDSLVASQLVADFAVWCWAGSPLWVFKAFLSVHQHKLDVFHGVRSQNDLEMWYGTETAPSGICNAELSNGVWDAQTRSASISHHQFNVNLHVVLKQNFVS